MIHPPTSADILYVLDMEKMAILTPTHLLLSTWFLNDPLVISAQQSVMFFMVNALNLYSFKNPIFDLVAQLTIYFIPAMAEENCGMHRFYDFICL